MSEVTDSSDHPTCPACGITIREDDETCPVCGELFPEVRFRIAVDELYEDEIKKPRESEEEG